MLQADKQPEFTTGELKLLEEALDRAARRHETETRFYRKRERVNSTQLHGQKAIAMRKLQRKITAVIC